MKKHCLLNQTRSQKKGHNYKLEYKGTCFSQTKYNTATIKASTAPFNSFDYSVKPRTSKNWTYISCWSMHLRTDASRLDIQYKITYDIPFNHVTRIFF